MADRAITATFCRDPRRRLPRRHRRRADRHGRRRADDAGADLPRRRRRGDRGHRRPDRGRRLQDRRRGRARPRGLAQLHARQVADPRLGADGAARATPGRRGSPSPTRSTTCSRCASASRCCWPRRRTRCASTSTCAGSAAAAPKATRTRTSGRSRRCWSAPLGGLLVGITSVGSGSVIMIALLMLYPGLSAVKLVGTDLVQAVPLVLAAAISNIALHGLDWSLTDPADPRLGARHHPRQQDRPAGAAVVHPPRHRGRADHVRASPCSTRPAGRRSVPARTRPTPILIARDRPRDAGPGPAGLGPAAQDARACRCSAHPRSRSSTTTRGTSGRRAPGTTRQAVGVDDLRSRRLAPILPPHPSPIRCPLLSRREVSQRNGRVSHYSRRLPAESARPAGGGVDPHLPRGRGRVREARPDVLGRQGLHRHDAPGGEGVLPGEDPVPRAAGRHRLRLPRGARVPRQLGQPARRPPRRRQRRGGDRQRRRRRRRQDQPQPAADRHPAQRHRGGGLHRRLRWRPPRRGEGPRQGARLLPPRRVRPVGPEDAAPRAVEPLQRPHPRRASTCGSSRSPTGPSWTSGTTSAARSIEIPVDLLLPPAPRLRARRDAAHRERAQPAAQGRDRRGAHRPLPHRRRPDPHRLRREPTPPPSHEIIDEIAIARVTERGATRGDDRFSEAAMEDRKKEGYF